MIKIIKILQFIIHGEKNNDGKRSNKVKE